MLNWFRVCFFHCTISWMSVRQNSPFNDAPRWHKKTSDIGVQGEKIFYCRVVLCLCNFFHDQTPSAKKKHFAFDKDQDLRFCSIKKILDYKNTIAVPKNVHKNQRLSKRNCQYFISSFLIPPDLITEKYCFWGIWNAEENIYSVHIFRFNQNTFLMLEL